MRAFKPFVIALSFVPVGACASGPDHIQIKFHQLTRGDHYACKPTDKDEKCTVIPPRSAEEENKSGTIHIIPPNGPPNGCQGRFNLMTIEDLDSDSPTMYVVCSPLEN